MAIIHGSESAPRRHFGEDIVLTPQHILSVGKSMLVGTLEPVLNVAIMPQAAEHVTRVIMCPHCKRGIVEYGTNSLPTKHRGDLDEEFLVMAIQTNMLVQAPCDIHGGDSYDPQKDLQIRV